MCEENRAYEGEMEGESTSGCKMQLAKASCPHSSSSSSSYYYYYYFPMQVYLPEIENPIIILLRSSSSLRKRN